ncbi:MAG: PDZ domain-containing protein [Candidatus Krumholzibacteria bacterium]|nr:PDZ domain-containing protein [Candidatus Krumholzibacteria bacterium]
MTNKSLVITRPLAVAFSIFTGFVLSLLVVQAVQAKSGQHGDRRVKIEHRMQGKEGAFLGVKMQQLNDDLREGLGASVKHGVVVSEVIDGSPAQKAGIKEGDIIVEFAGEKVESPDELQRLVAEAEIGDEVKIKLIRDKKSKTYEVSLGDWADNPTMVWMGPDDFEVMVPDGDDVQALLGRLQPRRLGVRVSDVNKDLGSYFGVKEGQGVLVLEVEGQTTAEDMGVKAGDVIVRIEGEEVRSVSDIHETMSELDAGDEVNVTVVRKKKDVKLKGEVKDSADTWLHSLRGHAPRMRSFSVPEMHFDRDDLREELDELRKEIEELKKELKKS